MFKLSEVQRLNSFHLFWTPSGGTPTPLFTGWTKEGLGDVDFSNKEANSLFGDVSSSDTLLQLAMKEVISPILKSAGIQGIGSAAVLDMRRMNLFNGSRPLDFSIDTYLFYTGVNSYEEEIIKPIKSLLGLYLPSRAGDAIEKPIVSMYDQYTEEHAMSSAASDSPLMASMWAFLNKEGRHIFDEVGHIYSLNIPKSYGMHLGFYIGTSDMDKGEASNVLFQVRDLEWTKFKLHFPKAFYVDEKGCPIYDHVKLHFEFRTLRPATSQMAEGMFMKNNYNITDYAPGGAE